MRLRIVSYNIHGGRTEAGAPSLEGIASTLAALQPDLAGLQEVHCRLPPPGVFQDQPRRLRGLLGMHLTFRPSFGTTVCGYGNAVVSCVPPLRVRRVLLPSRGEQRALIDTRFEIEGVRLRFLVTHFGLSPVERLEQAAVVARELRRDTLPAILAGDLNAGPDAPEMRVLRDAGLSSCVPADLPTYPSSKPAHTIDYVLVTGHFALESAAVVPSPASDHLAVVAEIRLAR
jgi:endonuclease/exonuclease/phosphatase family metal-dependent hydrolase